MNVAEKGPAMFLRTVKARGGGDAVYEYIRLVEPYREDGKNKQRTILNLGRKDQLAPHVGRLLEILTQDDPEPQAVRVEALEPIAASDWGPVLALRALWRELSLDTILDRLEPPSRLKVPLADRAFVLVANRLICPGSEHALAQWLETDYICDRQGRRWTAQWRDDDERCASRSPRVRVHPSQLQRWYRTLDQLYALKSEIEVELYKHLRDLFSLEVDFALYDLTSTYFQGHGPTPLAAHGHSRDQRPRQRQVLVGMVLVQGWPIAHHVFAGNRRDSTTVREVLEDLEKRFRIRRLIFVGDRGMTTAKNLEHLREAQQGYVLGLNRRRSPTVTKYVARATGEWIDCPMGITTSEKTLPPRTRVQEVASDEEGVRVFVVDSEERKAYESAEREKAMARVREKLDKLRLRVETGRLKAPEKIGAAAARILGKNHGQRYYDWQLSDGVFRFFEHPVNLEREKAYEGKWLIQTEEEHLSPLEAVQIYKSLSEVEMAFRHLKDVIEMRPIYHQTEKRTEAHLFVAALAFLLHKAMEKKLKAAGSDLSTPQALQILRSVRVVDLALGSGRTKRSVTRGSVRCAPILKALELTELSPPEAPAGRAEVM
jgi:transposase